MAQKTLEETFHATAKTDFNDAFWNKFLLELGTRFRALETIKIDWETVSQEGIQVALDRINEVLGPAAERVQNIAALGFLSVESLSTRTLSLGLINFIAVPGNQLDLFVPSPFVAVTRKEDPFSFGIGQVTYFDRDTGSMDIQIVYTEGDPGPFSSWTISAVAGQAIAQATILSEARSYRDAVIVKAEEVDTDAAQVAADKITVNAAKTDANTARSDAVTAASQAGASSIIAKAKAVVARKYAEFFPGVPVATATNRQIRSQEIDNAAYTKNNTVVVANAATAPDGTPTIDKVNETAVNGDFSLSRNPNAAVDAGLPHTSSIFAKAAERSKIRLRFATQLGYVGSAVFDLAAGTIFSTDQVMAEIEDWGGGIYRCGITATAQAGAPSATSGGFFYICADDGTVTHQGEAGKGVYAWGAQFEQSSQMGPYVATIAAAASGSEYSSRHWAGQAAASVGPAIRDAAAKSPMVDADKFGIWDSVGAVFKSISLANLVTSIFNGSRKIANGWFADTFRVWDATDATKGAGIVVSGVAANTVRYLIMPNNDVPLANVGKELGVNQTWQTVTRANATWYQNTTGRPIEVYIQYASEGSGAANIYANSTASLTGAVLVGNLGAYGMSSFIVPAGWYYYVASNLGAASELK